MTPWRREFSRLALVLSGGLLGGLAFGSAAWGLVVALGFLSAWHLYWGFRLERWMAGDRRRSPPEGYDLWGELYHHFDRAKRRNRRRKRQLAAILKQFQQSTAAMPDGTVVLDPQLRIVWFNQAAQRLLGLRSPQDMGQRVTNLLRHPSFLEYLAKHDYAETVTVAAAHAPGVKLSLQLVPYGDDQYLLLARDVTRLHQLDQVRRDFVANASHELRTPVTVVAGYLEALTGDIEAVAPDHRRVLAEMRAQTARMSRIIEDLLTLSRMEDETQRVVTHWINVAELAESVRKDFQSQIEGRLTMDVACDEGLQLLAAESDLRSVVVNLVSNAVKFTPAGGQIEVTWRAVKGGAELTVADTGIGIAAEHIPRLTERFYRVDKGRSRDMGGTGLGLAITKHALQRHDGELQVFSQLGQGSRFVCRFPPGRLRATSPRAPATAS